MLGSRTELEEKKSSISDLIPLRAGTDGLDYSLPIRAVGSQVVFETIHDIEKHLESAGRQAFFGFFHRKLV